MSDVAELVVPRLSRYVPHLPTEQQQLGLVAHRFLPPDEPAEIFYGGAAGGGKTDWLLIGALEYVDVPGYSALLLRRTFAELAKADSLIPRSHEWLAPTNARWNEQRRTWRFPSGATLEFGHLEYEQDKYAYQSAAYQFVGFDELTSFNESMYEYLFSRVRRPSEGRRAATHVLRLEPGRHRPWLGQGAVFQSTGGRAAVASSSPPRSRITPISTSGRTAPPSLAWQATRRCSAS